MRTTKLLPILLVLVMGCATPPDDAQPIAPILPVNVGLDRDCKRVAVCIGLDDVNPVSYDGWNGNCPGAVVDAKTMYSLFTRNGITSLLCLNQDATWANVKSMIRNATKDFTKDDLLIIMMSGHGGQVPDKSGDEVSGFDSTICFHDGQQIDDLILQFLITLPPMKIATFNDQCHSEGNFRAFTRTIQRAITFGMYGNKKGHALIKKVKGWDGEIIQFAGCRESSYSYGAESGGTWTQSLLATFKSSYSWKQWFDAAKKKMPSSQEPAFVTFQASESFVNGKVMK